MRPTPGSRGPLWRHLLRWVLHILAVLGALFCIVAVSGIVIAPAMGAPYPNALTPAARIVVDPVFVKFALTYGALATLVATLLSPGDEHRISREYYVNALGATVATVALALLLSLVQRDWDPLFMVVVFFGPLGLVAALSYSLVVTHLIEGAQKVWRIDDWKLRLVAWTLFIPVDVLVVVSYCRDRQCYI